MTRPPAPEPPSRGRVPAVPAVVGTACAVFVVLAGALVVIAWVSGRPHWLQPMPGVAPVQLNLGVAFTLLGLVLLLSGGARTRIVATVLLVAVLLLGVLTLLQDILMRDFGVDRVLFGTPHTVGTGEPGRMAPLAAVAVAVCAASLLAGLWLRTGGRRREAFWAAGLMAVMAGTLQLAGYALGQPGLGGNGHYTWMGLYAAVMFITLGIAAWGRVLNQRLTPEVWRRCLASAGPAAVVVVMLVAWLSIMSRHIDFMRAESGLVAADTRSVLEQAEEERIALMRRLVARWEQDGVPRTEGEWRRAVDLYLYTSPEVVSLSLRGADERWGYLSARTGPELTTLQARTQEHPVYRRLRVQARDDGDVQVSEVFELLGGRPGVLYAAWLDTGDEDGGNGAGGALLAMAVDIESALRQARMRQDSGFGFAAWADVGGLRPVLADVAADPLIRRWNLVTRSATRHAAGWWFEVWPTVDHLRGSVHALVRFLPALSLLLSLLLWTAARTGTVARQRADEALAYQRRMATAEQIAQLGYWGLDGETGRMTWSAQVYQIMGVSARDFSHDVPGLLARVHPEDTDKAVEALQALQRDSEAVDLTHRIVRPDGTQRWVRVRGLGRRLDNARTRAEGSVQDVTDVVLANAAVTRYSEQIARVAELARDVLATGNERETLQLIVARARDIVGAHLAVISREHAPPGSDAREAVSLSARYESLRDWAGFGDGWGLAAEVRETGRPLRLAGAEVPGHPGWRGGLSEPTPPPLRGWLGVPLIRRDGGIAGVLQLADRQGGDFDRTDERIAAQLASLAAVALENWDLVAEIQTLNTDLEHRVESRTRELAELNRELEAFAYSVSHDLRAPLRAITGFTRVLENRLQERLDERDRHCLNRIIHGADSMARLIDDLLMLARVSRQELVRQPVPLHDLVRDAFAQLAEADAGRAVDWTVDAPMEAIGDPRLLRVVVVNLVENAWKYTRGRDPAEIHFGQLVTESQTVYYVRDNGVGFDMKYADKLFGVFQRLHGGEEYPGTGIGLATVRRIVERHGGRVWAQAEPGEGAEFFFVLAARDGGEADDSKER